MASCASVHACSDTPVMRLEMIRGRISIFSILIRISPGKETIVRAELSVTPMYRSSIPNNTPMTTPGWGGYRYFTWLTVNMKNWYKISDKSLTSVM